MTYHEIEQSISREKANQTRGGGGRAMSQSHDSHSHSSSLPTSTGYTHQSVHSNSMTSRNSYQTLNAPPVYGVGYSVNDQRSIPAQGMHHLFASRGRCFTNNVSTAKMVPGPSFRQSPFYRILERLGPVHMCEGICSKQSLVS